MALSASSQYHCWRLPPGCGVLPLRAQADAILHTGTYKQREFIRVSQEAMSPPSYIAHTYVGDLALLHCLLHSHLIYCLR